ncbi:MAG TPA: sulfatase, partial [Opitutae bacterium]|nr:sulfatase [Opitutae bacterium]
MDLPINLQNTRAITRRHFFGQAGLGFGSIALNDLLTGNAHAAKGKDFRIPAKAKSIIYLHMAGSPSQIDLFENKPALTKFHGKDCPQEYLEGKRFAFIKGTPKMMG